MRYAVHSKKIKAFKYGPFVFFIDFVCLCLNFNLILNIFFKIPMEKMNAKNVSGTETADNVSSRCCGLSRNMLMAIVQGFFAHQVKIVHLIIEK